MPQFETTLKKEGSVTMYITHALSKDHKFNIQCFDKPETLNEKEIKNADNSGKNSEASHLSP